MRQFIEYAIDKWIECDTTYGKPKMHLQQYGTFNYRWNWELFYIKMKNNKDAQTILESQPLSIIVRTLDEEGVELEKYTIFNIDFIEIDGQYLKFKFGSAIINH